MSRKEKLSIELLEKNGVIIKNKESLPDILRNGIRITFITYAGIQKRGRVNYKKSTYIIEDITKEKDTLGRVIGFIDLPSSDVYSYRGHIYTPAEYYMEQELIRN